jgi:DHA1 family bicyclomycin/chloramphenicol resistance-like MFS transporter
MVLLGACSSLGPLALNVYLPGLPAVQAGLGGDLAAVQATVSLPLVAFGIALALLGPVADRHGRRATLLAGLVLFGVGCVVAALATSLGLLSLGRVVASVGTATTFIASRAVVADLSPREQLQRSVAQITLIMLVVQMIAPILGNSVLAFGGWRAIQYALLVLGAAIFLCVFIAVPETLPVPQEASARSGTLLRLLAPSMALLRRRPFVILLLQVGLLYSAYPAFIAIAPHLMIEVFHRPATDYSYYYAWLPVGYFAGNAFVLRFGNRWGTRRLVTAGAVVSIVSAALSLVLLSRGVLHPLALFLPAGMLVNFGIGLSLPSVSADAVNAAWPNTASGWGLVGFAQQLIAAVSVQGLGYLPASSPYPVIWICLALAAGALALQCLPRREAPHAGTAS